MGDLVGADHSFVVLVGNDWDGKLPQEFTLRCENFLPRSELFREACEKAWDKNSKCWSGEPIRLVNDSPKGFADYARFVYFGDIPEAPSYSEFNYMPQAHFSRQIQLYVLAERLRNLRTANLISDEIYTYSRDLCDMPGRDVINEAYGSTQPGSLLRALLRDMMIYDGDITHLHNEHPRGYDKAFSAGLLIGLMTLKGRKFDFEELETRMLGCRYHFHANGESKCTQSSSADLDEVISNRRASFR